MKVPGILKNKYVCYALMALAALNVIGYLTVKAWECLALFVLTAYSAHCYCGNKSCSILAALFVANFVFGCGRVKEGFMDAFKNPIEHLQNARDSLFRAREGFEATAQNCCQAGTDKLKAGLSTTHDADHSESAQAKCTAAADICANFGAAVDAVSKSPDTQDAVLGVGGDAAVAAADEAADIAKAAGAGQGGSTEKGTSFGNIF